MTSWGLGPMSGNCTLASLASSLPLPLLPPTPPTFELEMGQSLLCFFSLDVVFLRSHERCWEDISMGAGTSVGMTAGSWLPDFLSHVEGGDLALLYVWTVTHTSTFLVSVGTATNYGDSIMQLSLCFTVISFSYTHTCAHPTTGLSPFPTFQLTLLRQWCAVRAHFLVRVFLVWLTPTTVVEKPSSHNLSTNLKT